MALSGCERSEIQSMDGAINSDWLIDIAPAADVKFNHDSGIQGDYFLPEIMGSGAAVFDYDNDGYLDIYLINSGSAGQGASNRLFRQTADGTFTDATEESGLGDQGYGMGVAIGDIDNDGDLDLLATNYGDDHLYRNNGQGAFTEITAAAGIKGLRWSTSAAFCDVDEDGYLDLYISTYVTNNPPFACTNGAGEIDYCGPNAYRGVADQLYHNNGDGTFTDISAASGISQAVNNGLGVVCFDFNGDSHDDLFIANDGERNQLWLNDGKGNFVDRGVAFGIAVNLFGETEASMGIALGDVNGDLGLDLFLSHLDEETNTLYISTKGYTMMDATTRSGLGIASVPYTGFGTALFDADHDGDLDLAVANGRVRRGQEQGESLNLFHRIYAEPNLMMENTGSGEFRDFCNSTEPFCQSPAVSRGLLTADIDRDGDLDMLVTNSNGPVQLFQNNIPKHGGWLMLRVTELNRDAIGALAKIRTGKNWLVRPVIHTYSYLSSGDATVHFGLAQTGRVDEIEITWPDGVVEQFPGTDSNQLLIIRRGDGMNGHD